MEPSFPWEVAPNWVQTRGRLPNIKDTTNIIKKTTNSIFAIPTAVPAIPPKPRIPAMTAMIKKNIDQESIILLL
jgi:hypothetical protein